MSAISIAAVASISARNSLSAPGENSSSRSGEIVIGTPTGACSLASRVVPSFDGEAPWKILPASDCAVRSNE